MKLSIKDTKIVKKENVTVMMAYQENKALSYHILLYYIIIRPWLRLGCIFVSLFCSVLVFNERYEHIYILRKNEVLYNR